MRLSLKRINTSHMSAPLGCLVVVLVAVLWLVCFCASILVSALLVYGLWDLGRFLLGG